MIEAIGNVMARLTDSSQSTEEQFVAQAVKLCKVLEERVFDVGSYCRARVLKTFSYLCE